MESSWYRGEEGKLVDRVTADRIDPAHHDLNLLRVQRQVRIFVVFAFK